VSVWDGIPVLQVEFGCAFECIQDRRERVSSNARTYKTADSILASYFVILTASPFGTASVLHPQLSSALLPDLDLSCAFHECL
jgi:hypothetical protein